MHRFDSRMALNVSPSDALEFKVSADDDASQCALVLTNDSDETVAFKVKTTKPKRYLVRPNQGLVKPGETETVTIVLLGPEKRDILAEYHATQAWDDSNKFLVQSVGVNPEQYADSSKDQAQLLTDLWNDQSKGRKDVKQKKLTVKFRTDDSSARPPATTNLHKAIEHAKESLAHVRHSGTATAAGSRDKTSFSDDQLWDEVKALRKKYDDLVAFTVNLTAEKDLIQRSLDSTKEDLARETNARKQLESQSMSARRTATSKLSAGGSASTATAARSSSSSAGISLIWVVLLAAIAFWAGKWFAGMSASA